MGGGEVDIEFLENRFEKSVFRMELAREGGIFKAEFVESLKPTIFFLGNRFFYGSFDIILERFFTASGFC